MSDVIYVEPPRCLHHRLEGGSGGGECADCGARLMWVVEKPIDYEAAAQQMSTIGWNLMNGDRPPRQWIRAEARAVVNAALRIGGDDEAK